MADSSDSDYDPDRDENNPDPPASISSIANKIINKDISNWIPKQNRIPNIVLQKAPAPPGPEASASSIVWVVSTSAIESRMEVEAAGISGTVTSSSLRFEKSQVADEMMMEDDDQPELMYESPEKETVESPPPPESTLSLGPAVNDASSWTLEKFQEICKTVPYLEIPCHLGFRRTIVTEPIDNYGANTTTGISRSKVIYENMSDRARLNSMDEVHAYLQEKKIFIPVSCFTFETRIQPDQKYFKKYWKNMILKEDISDGLENVPIPVICHNSTSVTPNILATYVKSSFVGKKTKLSMLHEDGFFICCDCPDDCKDKLNCPCFQKTLENCSQRTRDAEGDAKIGYEFQRLYNSNLSGVFECNRTCKCRKSTCLNRVVQNGLVWRLQLFMTSLKGFGVRTLEDIPKGSFICTYAGKVVSGKFADKASENWDDLKWKFLSEIRIGEVNKEGYEAEVVTPEEPETKKVKKTEEDEDEWSMESEEGSGSDIEKETEGGILEVSQNVVEISGQEWNDFLGEEDENMEVEESGGFQDQVVLTSTSSTQQSISSPSSPCLSSATPTATVVTQDEDGNQTGEGGSGAVPPLDPINIPDTDPVPGTSSSSVTTSSPVLPIKGPPNPTLHLFPTSSDRILRSVYLESPQDYEMLPTGRSGYLNRSLEDVKYLSRLNANSRRMSECRLLPDKMPDRPRKSTIYIFSEDYHAIQPGGAQDRFQQMLEKNREELLKNQEKFKERLQLSTRLSKPYIENVIKAVKLKNDDKMNNAEGSPSPNFGLSLEENSTLSIKDIRKRSKLSRRTKQYKSSLKKALVRKLLSGVPETAIAKKGRSRRRKKSLYYASRKSNSRTGTVNSASSGPRPLHPLLKFDFNIDGREYGNIGRYMNHSCDPNVFPQHVFVNSHDLRLPEIAFFALRNISAGEELCWDYKYEVEGEREDKDDKQQGPPLVLGKVARKGKGLRKMKGKGGKKGLKRGGGGGACLEPRRWLPCYCCQDNCKRKFAQVK